MFWKRKGKIKDRKKRDKVLNLSIYALINDPSFASTISYIEEVKVIYERIEYSKQNEIIHYLDFNNCSFFVSVPKLNDNDFKKYIKALIKLDLMNDGDDLNPFIEIQKLFNFTKKDNDDFSKNYFKSFELIQLKISESMLKRIKSEKGWVQ
jgi:hypothetical protein